MIESMHDPTATLGEIFKSVFPMLQDREIESASMVSLPEWDSLATITLVSLVEQEFGQSIPLEDLDIFVSFDLIRNYILEGSGGGAP